MSHTPTDTDASAHPQRFPWSLYVVMLLALAGMMLYSRCFDLSPQATVTEFWQAFYNKDYPGATDNLSVAFMSLALPDYRHKPYNQLLNERGAMETKVEALLGDITSMAQKPQELDIEIQDSSTAIGNIGAFVFCKITKNNQVVDIYQIMLIKESNENGEWKIIEIEPINDNILKHLTPEIIKANLATFESDLRAYMQNPAPDPDPRKPSPVQITADKPGTALKTTPPRQ